MESIIDLEREEARSLARESDRDFDYGICPDIMGRDVIVPAGYTPHPDDPF